MILARSSEQIWVCLLSHTTSPPVPAKPDRTRTRTKNRDGANGKPGFRAPESQDSGHQKARILGIRKSGFWASKTRIPGIRKPEISESGTEDSKNQKSSVPRVRNHSENQKAGFKTTENQEFGRRKARILGSQKTRILRVRNEDPRNKMFSDPGFLTPGIAGVRKPGSRESESQEF